MGKTKYLVYLFDGTTQDWNRDEHKDWSNIVRLHTLCIPLRRRTGNCLICMATAWVAA